MEIKEKWEQLEECDRQQLLDRFRYINVEHLLWWDFTFEQFRWKCAGLGIKVGEIYFCGFGCQGDGACFDGLIADWMKFTAACGLSEAYAQVQQIGKAGTDIDLNVHLRWKHHGHYYHEYCVEFDDDVYIDNPYSADEDPLRHTAWEKVYKNGGPLYEHVDTMIEFIRSLMRDLFSDLESTYDDLTSDEEVTSYILKNEEDEIVSLLETNVCI